uniref:Uncharacterized protein n=1 Tax=Sinocyclocheilus anshuiensis TaxID=1608454 RepID=A0A671KHF4_9TELE
MRAVSGVELPGHKLGSINPSRVIWARVSDYEGYSAVTSALKSNPSRLRELNLSGNKLGDSGSV